MQGSQKLNTSRVIWVTFWRQRGDLLERRRWTNTFSNSNKPGKVSSNKSADSGPANKMDGGKFHTYCSNIWQGTAWSKVHLPSTGLVRWLNRKPRGNKNGDRPWWDGRELFWARKRRARSRVYSKSAGPEEAEPVIFRKIKWIQILTVKNLYVNVPWVKIISF